MRELKNHTEEQILEVIEKVVCRISKKYTFGYYAQDDIAQEARILALEAVNNGEYDESRSLENFLAVYIKNRLLNLKRNKYYRHEKPCFNCPFFDPKCLKSTNECAEFEDKLECERYALWVKLNTAKKNLVDTIDIYSIDDEKESNTRTDTDFVENSDGNELMEYISQNIPKTLREDYLKMLHNHNVRKSGQAKVTTAKQMLVMQEVAQLIEKYHGRA